MHLIVNNLNTNIINKYKYKQNKFYALIMCIDNLHWVSHIPSAFVSNCNSIMNIKTFTRTMLSTIFPFSFVVISLYNLCMKLQKCS